MPRGLAIWIFGCSVIAVMKTSLDCISCWVRMALQASRLAGADESTQQDVMAEVLELLRKEMNSDSPLRIAEKVQHKVAQRTGCEDPYMHLKINCNEEAGRWIDRLQEGIESVQAQDRLLQALKIATVGNCMDYGAFAKLELDRWLSDLDAQVFAVDDSPRLAKTLRSAKTLTYFADNTGEIVFDAILIGEILKQRSFDTIRLVIREHPFLNDVSSEEQVPELLRSHPNVEIVPFPIVRRREVQHLWEELVSSDVVIAKGMANYENYIEQRGFYFLLIAKCDLVSGDLRNRTGIPVATGDWVLYRS